MKTTKFLLVVILAVTTLFSAEAGNDKPISFDQLPETSKVFIREYFKEADISYAKIDRDLFSKSYEVYFINGNKIEFDKKGEWDTVECLKCEIPSGIVPALIAKYVEKNHPDFTIVKIERNRRNYEIELNNELEIKFDLAYNVIGYDD